MKSRDAKFKFDQEKSRK